MANPDDALTLVQTLASHAALPLHPERRAPVGQLLAAWIKDANALSAKMSAPQYAAVSPITGLQQVICHGEVSDDQ